MISICYKILLLHLMGLKLISKFFFSGEAGFSCLACCGFGVCQTLQVQQEAVWEIKKSKIRP